MSRIKTLFQTPGNKLIPYITAGFPTKDLTVDLVLAAERAGADMVELGMPFSDPLADGPVIQEASQVALKNGTTLGWILEQVRAIRESSNIPIVLMGYINPILQYGLENFTVDSRKAGVDGFIIPDLPPEEATEWINCCKKNRLSPILFVAPTTQNKRIREISELAGDLVYCLAILGITGADLTTNQALSDYLSRVRKNSTTPFVVGFGIKTRKDYQIINEMADGAVIGTAFIQKIAAAGDPVSNAEKYIRELKGNSK